MNYKDISEICEDYNVGKYSPPKDILSFYDCKNRSYKQECQKRYDKYVSKWNGKISELLR